MGTPHFVAAAAAVGNFLQGWDSGAIAGALLYIKPEFHLEEAPATEGLIIACSVIGGLCSTSVAGFLADKFGRRAVLCMAGALYLLSACGMALSPDVYELIAARFVVGCAYGFSSTIVPLLIAETAPSHIRGQLATFPQLTSSGGTFLAYCMVFGLSLGGNPSWRWMTASLLFPSILYLFLCFFYLPESPRWLVSKGRMLTAKQVLQKLLNRDNVAAELALLVEGLGSGSEATIEEYVVEHAENIDEERKQEEEGIHLYGIQEDESWIAKPASFVEPEQRMSIFGSQADSNLHHLMDPTVALIGSFQQPLTDQHLDGLEEVGGGTQWDEENPGGTHDDHHDGDQGEDETGTNLEDSMPNTPMHHNDWGLDRSYSGQHDGLRTPLLSQNNSEYAARRSDSRGRVNWGGESSEYLNSAGNLKYPRKSSIMGSWYSCPTDEGMGLGGGWQLAWQWQKSGEANESGRLKRVFLFPESVSHAPSAVSSMRSLPGLHEHEPVQVAALVGEAALCLTDAVGNVSGPAIVHPSKIAKKGLSLSDFLEIRVRRALAIGLTLQLLQQFCGISAVIFFTPQILEHTGVDTLLVQAGIESNSASLLASAVTSLPMLPFLVFAMWLMDRAGRRQILLTTTPVLFVSMLVIVVSNQVLEPGLVQGGISIVSLMVFFCSFSMGFGAIPNILCSEIFPTRVRGVCLGLCGIMMWISNMIITFSFPTLNKNLGLSGVFGFFAVMSVIAWVFIFLKVPETKGFPLEVISEFFAVASTSTVKKDAPTGQKHSKE